MTPRARSRALAAAGVAALAVSVLLFQALVDDLPVITHEAGDTEENTARVWGAQTLGQTFVPPPTNVSAVELGLRGAPGTPLTGVVRFHLRRTPDAPEDLRTVEVHGPSIRRGAATRFQFPPLATRTEPSLTALVEYQSGTAEAPLVVRVERPRADGQPRTNYPHGTALENGAPLDADLAFRVLSKGRRPFGVQVAGAALVGGLALLVSAFQLAGFGPRAARAVLMAGLPIISFLPLFQNPSFLGAGDWDMNSTLHAAATKALVEERTFPGWNPYLCGGTPLAAFPEAPVFSPFFGTVLLGGPLVGFKINIVLHAIIGFIGMAVWLRRGWGTTWLAAFLGASLTMFSSFLALHIAEGHTRKVAFAWIPWVLFFFQRAAQGEGGSQLQAPGSKRFGMRNYKFGISPALRYSAPAGAALALMFLDGSVYLALYTTVAVALLGVLLSVQRRTLLPAVAALCTLTLAGLLAGAHLIPVLVSQQHLRPTLEPAKAHLPLRSIIDVFLDPNQDAFAEKFEHQPLLWSEYGAYVGFAAVLLAVLGVFVSARTLWPWVGVGAAFFGGAFFPTIQTLFHSLPVVGALRNPQRRVSLVVVIVALAAAVGFDRVLRWLDTPRAPAHPGVRLAAGTLSAVLIGHLVFVSSEMLAGSFRYPPPPPAPASAFQQGWARRLVSQDADSFPFTLENAVQNRGSANRCSVASVRPSGNLRFPPPETTAEVGNHPASAPYAGEAYLVEGRGTVSVRSLRTSDAVVAVTTDAPAHLALNQNVHLGWRASVSTDGGKPRSVPATDQGGIVTIQLPRGSSVVTFSYVPPGLALGLLASGAGFLAAVWLWSPTWRRR